MKARNVGKERLLSQFLRMAVVAGVESAVQLHIERGDDLDARDASGMTPLMLSAVRNKPAICKLLLSAGADHSLLDPSGRTALDIAVAAGAEATAAILGAVQPSLAHYGVALASEPDAVAEPSAPLGANPEEAALDGPENVAWPTEPEVPSEPPAPAPPPSAVIAEMDDGEFDLSGWETEEESTRPEADLGVVNSASAIQTAITNHEPVDSSAEWDDVEAWLPESALPLARADDAEGRARLRRLLLRAIREGSVPSLEVQAQSTNEDGSANPEAEAYLAMVINDLGAEVDERLEYSSADKSYGVLADPEEMSDEQAAIDEALIAIDRASSPRHDPLQIYQREFQKLRLLSAEEEIQLAKNMEAALKAALDALAEWPVGIARTLAAGANAIAGSRPLSTIWVGGSESDPAPSSASDLEPDSPATEKSDDAGEEDDEPSEESISLTGEAGFADALRRLALLVAVDGTSRATIQEIRQALAALRLNRRFLLELIDSAHGSASCPRFRSAMADFRNARDRMTGANLKLAFFHAKKYLYSGEPLDDLAQEANIGLLKAVDRYDWRRGFRFSTYATWWIRQQISRYVADKVRIIRIPVHIHEKVQRLDRVAQAFERVAGREPTVDELADRMEMPRHKLAALLAISPAAMCIDELPIDDMITVEARDTYSSADPADVVHEIQLNRSVDRLISSLSPKDRKEEQVLRLRFGIGVDDVLTLEELGTRFTVTRERIRQIETQAIRKLRHRAKSEAFGRLVLGLNQKYDLTASTRQPDEVNGTDTMSAAPEAPTKRPARTPSPESIQPVVLSKPTALDRVIAQAAELGIPVEDGREAASGRIWVSLIATPDNPHRQLARKLIELGFIYATGKGYWR